MTTTITPDDLLSYVYGEASEAKKQALELIINTDEKFRKQYEELREAKNHLDSLVENPSGKVIEKILDFSRQYDLHSV
jgi:anti-sigma factor RsiW